MTRDIARPVYQIPRHRQRHVSPVAHAPASAEAARRGIDCPSCQAIAPPMARFCPQCGIDLRGLVIPMHHEDPATPPARAGQWLAERRQLTVVFCDLIGSSELATRVDPEDFAELIGRYHRCISETMGRYGGFFARPMGDGALVFFGFPVAHEDDAERAVRASLLTVEAIAATAASGGPRLHVRIGIASGIAIVGDVADTAAAHRLDAAGEVVNLAARLQQIAEPNSVVIAENVRRLLGKLFVYRDLGECLLKGWDAPIAVAQVVRPAANPSRFRARSSRPVTPLVGRREPMESLTALWAAARSGAGGVALITGEPGIGKSRLVAQLMVETALEPHTRLRWFCVEHQQGVALHPCVQQLEHIASFRPEDPPALRLAKLEALLSGASAEDVNLIASLMQLPIDPASPVLQFSIQRRRERTLQALLQVLIRTAHQRPVLAVMEDAHWSDPTTAELVSLVAREGASLPLCLVITARPEFIPDWIAHAGVKHVLLQPLGSEHSAELVRSMSGSDALTETIVRAIVTRSDGVPLFLEELTQSVLERTSGEGSYAEVVPASIHASLLARLDRLGQARAVVEAAATIGRDFDSELLKHVHEGDDDSLNAALRLLVDADLAFPVGPPGSGKFRFKHALIQDTAYNTMLRERRRLMHGRIAQALVTHFQQMAAAEPQILAHHYTEAGLNDRAAEWWLRAGAQSLRRAATDEAMAQLRRGLALCQTLPETELRQRLELDLQIMICKSLIATKGHGADSFSSHLACAKALCAKLHEPPQLLTILFQEWTRSVFWGDLVLARQQTEQLSGLARTRQGPLWELLASYTGGFTHFILGQFDEAHRLMRRGLDVFEPSRRDEYASHYVGDPRSMLRTFLAWERTCTGHLTEAIAVSDAAISEARALGNTYSLANALGTRGSIHSFIGTVEEGLAAADELQLLADEYGIAYFRGTAACLRGWFQSRLGDPDGGLNLVREGQEIYRRIGIRLHMPMALRFEADLLGRRDCLAEGFAKIAEARAVAADTDQFWDYAETLRVEGELLGRAGDRDAAETALRKAYSTALEEGARLFALRARLSLAALQCRNNRDTDMAAALAWFGSISDLPDVSRARQLLEDLQWMM